MIIAPPALFSVFKDRSQEESKEKSKEMAKLEYNYNEFIWKEAKKNGTAYYCELCCIFTPFGKEDHEKSRMHKKKK